MKTIIIQPVMAYRRHRKCNWHDDCEVIGPIFTASFMACFFIIPAIPKVFKRLKQNIFGPAKPRYWETINSKRTDGK